MIKPIWCVATVAVSFFFVSMLVHHIHTPNLPRLIATPMQMIEPEARLDESIQGAP